MYIQQQQRAGPIEINGHHFNDRINLYIDLCTLSWRKKLVEASGDGCPRAALVKKR